MRNLGRAKMHLEASELFSGADSAFWGTCRASRVSDWSLKSTDPSPLWGSSFNDGMRFAYCIPPRGSHLVRVHM